MLEFSSRLNNMEESATLAMSRLSRELKAQGKDIISLSLGEPDFDTPQHIKDAAIKAINDFLFEKYGSPAISRIRDTQDKRVIRYKIDLVSSQAIKKQLTKIS